MKDVQDFYDDFVAHQEKIGVSVRHRLIHKKLKSIGLNVNSNVLEIGCGIGTVSSLIIKSISNGKFVGCDISEKSIEYANRKYGSSSVEFICTDMSDFTHATKFDFVVFPDVLEHIPVEQHKNLFEKVSKTCSSKCTWLINIPEPNALNYYRKNQPEILQIIDQSLSISHLLSDIQSAGFEVVSVTPYAIHKDVNNYLSIVVSNSPEVTSIKQVSKIKMLIQNLKARI